MSENDFEVKKLDRDFEVKMLPPRDGFYERNPYQDEADRIGVPVIPALPGRPLDPNPVVAICGACGRKVRQVEMYSCSKGNCPIQPRAIF